MPPRSPADVAGADSLTATPKVIILSTAILATQHVTAMQVGRVVRRPNGLWERLTQPICEWFTAFLYASKNHYLLLHTSDGRTYPVGPMKEENAVLAANAVSRAIYEGGAQPVRVDVKNFQVNNVDARNIRYDIRAANGPVIINEASE